MADTLSRLSANALHTEDTVPVIDFRAMAAAQADELDLARLQADSSLKLKWVALALSDGVDLLCDVSTGIECPVVPESFRRPIFDSLPIPESGQRNA